MSENKKHDTKEDKPSEEIKEEKKNNLLPIIKPKEEDSPKDKKLLLNKRKRENVCRSCGANGLENYNFTNLENIFEFLLDNADKKLQSEFNDSVKKSNNNFNNFCKNCFMQKFINSSFKAFEDNNDSKQNKTDDEISNIKELFTNYVNVITLKIEEISDKFYRDSIETEQILNKTALQLMVNQKKQFQKFNDDMTSCKALLHKDRENFDNFKELIKSLTVNISEERSFFCNDNINHLNKYLSELRVRLNENNNNPENDKTSPKSSPSNKLKNLQKEKLINSNIGIIPSAKNNRNFLAQLNMRQNIHPYLYDNFSTDTYDAFRQNNNFSSDNQIQLIDEISLEGKPNPLKKKTKLPCVIESDNRYYDLNLKELNHVKQKNVLSMPGGLGGYPSKININPSLNQLKLQQQNQLTQKELLNPFPINIPGINPYAPKKQINDIYQNFFPGQPQLSLQNSFNNGLLQMQQLNPQQLCLQQSLGLDNSFNQGEPIPNIVPNPYQMNPNSQSLLQSQLMMNMPNQGNIPPNPYNLDRDLIMDHQKILSKIHAVNNVGPMNQAGLKMVKPNMSPNINPNLNPVLPQPINPATLNQSITPELASSLNQQIMMPNPLEPPISSGDFGITGINPIDSVFESIPGNQGAKPKEKNVLEEKK